jgi:hypothetical protein
MMLRTRFVSGIAAVCLSASLSPAALIVTEVMSSSGVTPDWFELTNTGASAVSLTGYRVDDSSFSTALSVALNNISSIGAGESVVFIEAVSDNDISNFRSYWGAIPASAQVGRYNGSGIGFSSGGDGIVVYDASNAAVTPNLTFPAATTGTSFDFNVGPTPLLSVVGVGGAYTSTTTFNATTVAANIGSPTVVAVPEPAALAVLSLGAVAMLRRRAK